MARVRRILFWVLIAFAIYSIITSPERAAEMVRTAWGIIVDGFKGIASFFDALLQRD